jgi:hypothetical protein
MTNVYQKIAMATAASTLTLSLVGVNHVQAAKTNVGSIATSPETNAVTVNFYQHGFSGGGTFKGSFSFAENTTDDGIILHQDLSAFFAEFVGDNLRPDEQWTLTDTFGDFYYDFGKSISDTSDDFIRFSAKTQDEKTKFWVNENPNVKGQVYGSGLPKSISNEDVVLTIETESVPEPLTILGSATALGFAVLLKREYSQNQKKS